MLDVFERATWPLRKLVWLIEEKLVWPVSDALRGRGAHAAPVVKPVRELEPPVLEAQLDRSAEPSAEPGRRLKLGRGRDVVIALATVTAAALIGIGIASLVRNPAPDEGATIAPASAPAAAGPDSGPAAVAKAPSTLQGVAPDFQASAKSDSSDSAAASSATTTTSPLAGTNSKPSSIPDGVASDATALKTARGFAGAFVLYEVGKTSAKVKQTFARTATPALARALRDRPPRLPDSVKVPIAKVQNVVIGDAHGKTLDASISLLRLGDLSELRLTLKQQDGGWAVSEVRG
jgi:hypothetical protein